MAISSLALIGERLDRGLTPALGAPRRPVWVKLRLLKPSLLDHPAIWQAPNFGQDRDVLRVLASSSKFAGVLKNTAATKKRSRPNPLDHKNYHPKLFRQAYKIGSRRATWGRAPALPLLWSALPTTANAAHRGGDHSCRSPR